MNDKYRFEAVEPSRRGFDPRHRYDSLFAAVIAGETVLVRMPEKDERNARANMMQAWRGRYGHTKRLAISYDPDGLVCWLDGRSR